MLRRVDSHLKEKLKDPYFRELYEIEQQKLGIAKLFIDYRIKHNLTQEQFAEKLGVTQQYISKIENGNFANLTNLEIFLFLIGFRMKINVEPLPRRFRDISKVAITKLRQELITVYK